MSWPGKARCIASPICASYFENWKLHAEFAAMQRNAEPPYAH